MYGADLKAGKYVVAVSGGVDSAVLLDLLAQQRNLSEAVGNRIAERQVSAAGLSNLTGVDLLVAHFNHGIRADSSKDEQFVSGLAAKYGWPFEAGHGRLGAGASEETARNARYRFLNSVKDHYKADAIITAHHQDDLIETALINILRGTGPQGLVAMQSNQQIVRPLLSYSKQQIYDYAQKNHLTWHEDPTNQNTDYLRNFVRHNLLSKMSAEQRQQVLNNIKQIAKTKKTKDNLLAQLSATIYEDKKINRQRFASLPSEVGSELLVYWLRQTSLVEIDKKLIGRLNVLVRTAHPGSRHNIKNGLDLSVTKLTAQFERTV